jgi:RNA polymerase primary sigma factor
MERFESEVQSHTVRELLDQAEERGYITLDEILRAFPEAEDDLDALDSLFAYLHDQDVEVRKDGGDVDLRSDQAEIGTAGGGNRLANLNRVPIEDAVGLYLTEMSWEPLLTPEEEVDLARRLEQGREAGQKLSGNGHNPKERAYLERVIREGLEARNRLVKANTRLVVSIAKKYRGLGLPFLDLIQAGNVGLLRAVDRYDYHLGYRFGTYATWWIRQAVTRALSEHGRTIRLPVHLGDRIRRVYRVMQKLEQDIGRWPTPEEVADEVGGLDPDEVRRLMRVAQRPRSLHEPVGDAGDASEFGDFIEDEETPSPVETVELQMLSEDIEEMLASLTPREARILRWRYGLSGERPLTLKEIGTKIGVSRERVRQIAAQALRKLRHPRYRRQLQSYLEERGG